MAADHRPPRLKQWWPQREGLALNYPPCNLLILLVSFIVLMRASYWPSYWSGKGKTQTLAAVL